MFVILKEPIKAFDYDVLAVNLETFKLRDKSSKETTERIAQLEQLVGQLTVAVDIQKKALTLLSEKRDPDAQGGKDSPE